MPRRTAFAHSHRSPRRSVIAVGLAALTIGCPSPPAPRSEAPAVIRLVNRAPIIQAVRIDADGRRLRTPRLGAAMQVRVVASDPDGDPLRFAFEADPDTATVRSEPGGHARWSPGGRGPARLRVRVMDRRGLTVERVLVAERAPRLAFGGWVSDAEGRAIGGVAVRVDDATARTDARGRFDLTLADAGQARFVLRLEHPAYGPLSVPVLEPVRNGRWTLAPASTVTVDLAAPVVATVTAGGCARVPSSRVAWAQYPRQRQPVQVHARTPLTAAAGAPLVAALAESEGMTSCPAGFSVRAGANAFVRANGTPATGAGQVSLTQIPAWGGASMPGDYTVRRADGSTRVMQSFGAATVRVTSGGDALQLRPGQRATLRWPVVRGRGPRDVKPMPEVPLLRYDETRGEWREDGMARLDADGGAWSVEVEHLSTFNLDLLKVQQACVRVDATALPAATFELEVTVPQEGLAAVVRTGMIDNAVPTQHVLYNLPTQTEIAVRVFRDVGGTPEPLGTFVVNTGDTQSPVAPNPPEFPYEACQGVVAVQDLGASVTLAETDGDATTFGPFTPVYIGVVDGASGDLLPTGPTGLPVVGIYDPGSTSVFITDVTPNRFSGAGPSDADRLGASADQLSDVRVSALQSAASAATAPMGAAGAPDEADAEVGDVRIRVRGLPGDPDLSLLGSPFFTQRVAWIDYTQLFAIPGTTPVELGAWSRYFATGEPGIPLAAVTVPLARFGGGSGAATYTTGPRFLVQGMTFYNRGRAVGHAEPGAARAFFLDLGTTWTGMSAAMTTALLLTDADIVGTCPGGPPAYEIERIEFVGIGGRYVIHEPIVCRSDGAQPQVGAGQWSDALVGSNLFRRMAVVLDGPGNTLGVFRP